MKDLIFSQWGPLLGVALVIVAASWLLQRVLRKIILRLARFSAMLQSVVHHCDRPAQFVIPLTALLVLWQGAPDDVVGLLAVQHVTEVLTIAALAWMAAHAVQGAADAVIELHPVTGADNLQSRRVQTQTRVLARIANGAVLLAGLAFILMTFPRARQFGASLLASAGVAGLVVGIAARSVFGNLLAGLQIALAQPLRIDDVLIVEGEWGRVEEITATYVVLKIWDERRLIIPLQWFIEHPFQNWTRQSAELLGTVFLWVDYTLPVEPIRAETKRLCEASKQWDRRVCVVQVTDANEHGMQLRILVSAASSGDSFDLQCFLRENLINFIQAHHPHSLPRLRADLETAPPAAASRPNAAPSTAPTAPAA